MAVIDNKALIPPAEWEEHKAIWTAWPTGMDLWAPDPKFAREEVANMIGALSQSVGGRQGDKVKLLVKNDEAKTSAQDMVGDIAEIISQQYGDIWLRDTGPIFQSAEVAAVFQTNGWGEKYIYEHDDKVGKAISWHADAIHKAHDFILEGGAIDGDGLGTFLTTRECLLNPNRNMHWKSETDAEQALASALGAKKVIWLDGGLLNDHTDGHVDNVARFVGPSHVVCQSPYGEDDPNADVLDEIYSVLASQMDACGKKLRVTRIPSPGVYRDLAGDIAPASHMNFIIGNGSVVVPTYGNNSEKAANEAIAILKDIFVDRRVIGLPSNYILTGGGSFHCITQQQPA